MDQRTHDDPFVTRQLTALAPAWTPDLRSARVKIDDRLSVPRSSGGFAATIAALALLALVMLTPQARSYAQDVWARWKMTRVDVVSTSVLEPFATRGSIHGGGTFETLADVERAAGLALHLPPAGVAGRAEQFLLVDSVVVEQTVDVMRLEAALRRAGAADVQVPREWEGALIRAHVRNVVVARYANDLTVTQAALPSLDVPVGIPLSDLAATTFRAWGMPAEAARAAGLAYAVRPAWLLRVGAEHAGQVERLSLRNGEAWLLGNEWLDAAFDEVAVVRSDASRFYVVTSTRRDRAVAVAEALP